MGLEDSVASAAGDPDGVAAAGAEDKEAEIDGVAVADEGEEEAATGPGEGEEDGTKGAGMGARMRVAMEGTALLVPGVSVAMGERVDMRGTATMPRRMGPEPDSR